MPYKNKEVKALWVSPEVHKGVHKHKLEHDMSTVDDVVKKAKCGICGTAIIGGQHQ